jgi:hypothetical protein
LIEAIQLMGNPTGEGMMAAGGAEVNPCFAAGPSLRDAGFPSGRRLRIYSEIVDERGGCRKPSQAVPELRGKNWMAACDAAA